MAEKKPLCGFGKKIEFALIQKDKTNDWLIEKSRRTPDDILTVLTFSRLRQGSWKRPASRKASAGF